LSEEFIGVIMGIRLAHNETVCKELILYKRERKFNTTKMDEFVKYKKIPDFDEALKGYK